MFFAEGNRQMKAIYSAFINPRREICKAVFFLSLLCLYRRIYHLLYRLLYLLSDGKLDDNRIFFADRILLIVLLCAGLVRLRARFLRFVRKNWDSLVLLGCSYPKRFFLFFLTNYEVLFFAIYFGAMIFQIQELTVPLSISVSILNAVLICLLAVLSCVGAHARALRCSVYTLAVVLGIVIGADKLSFHNVSFIIMSDHVSRLLFSDTVFSALIKMFFCLCLLFGLIYRCGNAGIDASVTESPPRKTNMTGDLIHRFSKSPLYFKNYFWMYRNTDFVLWKLFSTVLFVLICRTAAGNAVIFLIACALCLISAFYFVDTYNLERRLSLYYFMSDYPYKRILADFTKGGFFLLGDNILAILFIRCLIRPCSLIVLILVMTAVFFVSVFVNSHLFAKYPMKQYYLNACLILLKLCMPVFHFWFLYKCVRDGRKNWENRKDG